MNRVSGAVALSLLGFLSGCRTSPIPNAAMTAPAGPIELAYKASYGTERELVFCEEPQSNGINEISLERTPCFGFCSTYSMTLHEDGRVRYHGSANVERVGEHHGTIPTEQFRYLARLAEEIGYFDLDSSYACAITDNPTVYTSVSRGAQKKIIRHYAPYRTGPARLRAFEEAVAAAYEWIEWTK